MHPFISRIVGSVIEVDVWQHAGGVDVGVDVRLDQAEQDRFRTGKAIVEVPRPNAFVGKPDNGRQLGVGNTKEHAEVVKPLPGPSTDNLIGTVVEVDACAGEGLLAAGGVIGT